MAKTKTPGARAGASITFKTTKDFKAALQSRADEEAAQHGIKARLSLSWFLRRELKQVMKFKGET